MGESSSSEGSTGEPVDPSLLLWLEFAGDGAATLEDSSSYQGTAACPMASCPSSETGGPVGFAGSFDGSDDQLQIPAAPHFEVSDALTAMAWVRPSDFAGDSRRAVVGQAYGDTIRNSWLILFVGSTATNNGWSLALNMNSAADDLNLTFPVSFMLNTWVHVAATYDGTTGRLYIDGQEVGSSPFNPPIYDDHPITVGHDINSGTEIGHFDGGIDEVRIYDRVLAPAEITQVAGQR